MYRIDWKEKAVKELDKLDASISRRIFKSVDELKDKFSEKDIKKLKGYSNLYRLRVGDFRVIFELERDLIIILKIGHRESIYER
jgi:mRNA interferase RelE/StbE